MKLFTFNNIGLRHKLLLIYICCVFIPITLTHILFYQTTSTNVKTQKMNDLALSVERMSNEFLLAINDAVGISSMMYTDYELYTFLDTNYESTRDYVRAYNNYYDRIRREVPLYSPVHSITLYTDNETALYAGGIKEINSDVRRSQWYKDSEQVRNSHPILTRTIGDSGDLDTFSVIREMDNYVTIDSNQKILEIKLDSGLMYNLFHDVTFPGEIYLLSGDGVIEYTTDPAINWSEGRYRYSTEELPDDMILFEESFGERYLSNWTVVGAAPEHVLLEEVANSRNFIIYLALINLIFPSLIIIYITSSLHSRIFRILKHMRKVEDQDFELIDGAHHGDEIGELTHAFNRMAYKIKKLINDVYVADIQKKNLELKRKQAQLSALQSQINPHFLFNVLETIRMRSLLKKEDETANIIHNIASMLRKSFIWGRDWVKVEEEIYLIKCFLEIQYYRFDDKMQYQIDIDPDAYECLLPNMSLIPFVENASIHGIEPIKGKGMITISIRSNQDQLICEISDSGQGMEKEEYDKLMRSLEEADDIGEHVGIKNVYCRLKLHYGDDFEFGITSTKGFGTTVSIILPCKR